MKAVETAVIEKSTKLKKEFKPDQEFFQSKDDIGMCISMH
jgi:hypothetical protein